MAKNDFFRKSKELADMVGSGNLSGIFAVDGGERTIPLEVGYWENHMGRNGKVGIRNWTTPGTGPYAAQKSFQATFGISLEDIAKTTLETGPQEGMKRHVGRVRENFKQFAPMEFGPYRESTAGFVVDNGQPVHEEYGSHYGQEPRA